MAIRCSRLGLYRGLGFPFMVLGFGMEPPQSDGAELFGHDCMAAHHHTPHFHNDIGVPTIRVGVREFMCTGALPPFDHPHTFIDMGDSDDAVCPYCSTRYLHDGTLGFGCEPAACEYRPDTAP